MPPEQLYVQAAAMTGASSVTTIMFTEADGGEQHCQVGNTLLPVRRILAWLDALAEREN